MKKYRVLHQIGRGKFSTVFKAERLADGLLCVLKKIRLAGKMDSASRKSRGSVHIVKRASLFVTLTQLPTTRRRWEVCKGSPFAANNGSPKRDQVPRLVFRV